MKKNENNGYMDYSKLWQRMEKVGKKKSSLVHQGIIHCTTYRNLIRNREVSTGTICKICKFLDCQPGNIMEYVEE